jgi:hypothetical protein
VGEDYVYWSDYDKKKLWSLPKDGSWKNPVNLRTYRNPAMGVVVFRHQPLNCDLISSQGVRDDSASVQKTELIENLVSSTTLLGFTVICFVLMAIMILFIIKFVKSKDCKGIRGSSKSEDTVTFQNFSNTSIKMTDLVIFHEKSFIPIDKISYLCLLTCPI